MSELKPEVLTFARLIRDRFGGDVAIVQATLVDGSERYTKRYPCDTVVDSHETFDYKGRHG